MKIRAGYVCYSMGSEHVVVAVGDRTHEFKGTIRLNDAGLFLWELMKSGTTREALANALAEKYGLAADEAWEDVRSFLRELMSVGVVEI